MGNSSWTGQRRAFPTATRRRILDRDGHRCVQCGRRSDPLIADHIIPVAEGGTDHASNGQTLCPACHDTKTRQEIARGRARMPSTRRPPEPHPGLLP